MARMTVEVAGQVTKVSGVNAAYNFAGEQAKALQFSAPMGTTIIVRRDGVATLTYTLVEVVALGQTIRDWRLS